MFKEVQPGLGVSRLNHSLHSTASAAPFPPPPQVFKEVQPGLGVSRLNHAEFLHFAELATLATRYVRVNEVRLQHAGLA